MLSWVVSLYMVWFKFPNELNLTENLINSRIITRNWQIPWQSIEADQQVVISLYMIQIASKAEFELLKTELTIPIELDVTLAKHWS